MGCNVSGEFLIDAGFDATAIKHRSCEFRLRHVEKTLDFNRVIEANESPGFGINPLWPRLWFRWWHRLNQGID